MIARVSLPPPPPSEDLASIEGTGVGGRIRKQDVLAAADAAKAGGGAAPAAAAEKKDEKRATG